jgi:predicted metalloprotease
LAADLDAFWQRTFVAEGRFYGRPTFVLIEDVTPTACATDGAVLPGAGSFYCPWNQTIYLDVTALLAEGGSYGWSGLLFTLAHEWGHHAQFQRGGLQERTSAVELTADCLAGAYLADAVGRGLLEADLVEQELRVVVAALGDPTGIELSDAQAHGSGEQRATMLMLGYSTGASACGA